MKKKFTFLIIGLIAAAAAAAIYYTGFIKSAASAREINVTRKKVVLTSHLSGVAMKAKIVTYKNDNKTLYKTTYYTYGKNPLPMWTEVKYLPENRPINPAASGNWTIFNKFRNHNSILNLNFPAVSWKYKQYDAISLKGLFPSVDVLGKTRGAVMFTQFVGDSVGVSYYNGIVYIPSNNDMLYAVNAKTGKLIWRATTAGSVMSVPLAVNGVVYITIGNAAFSGANGPFAILTHNLKNIRRGDGYGGVYAFSAYSGKLLWVRFTAGEVMPTALYINNMLIFANGSGRIYALNAKSGKIIWKKYMGISSFTSMSSTNYYTMPDKRVIGIVGTTLVKQPFGKLVAFNIKNGKTAWQAVLPKEYKPFNTGMGDVSPAVDQKHNLVIQDTIVNFNRKTRMLNSAIVAVKASTGRVKWVDLLGKGYVPPAFKGGVPVIHDGRIYVGSPVTSKIYAINEFTGKVLWSSKIPTVSVPPKTAGGVRGNPVIYGNKLILAAGAYIFTYNANTGKLLKRYYTGGRFGLVNPVIVGKTVFVSNSYNYTFAIPLKKLL